MIKGKLLSVLFPASVFLIFSGCQSGGHSGYASLSAIKQSQEAYMKGLYKEIGEFLVIDLSTKGFPNLDQLQSVFADDPNTNIKDGFSEFGSVYLGKITGQKVLFNVLTHPKYGDVVCVLDERGKVWWINIKDFNACEVVVVSKNSSDP